MKPSYDHMCLTVSDLERSIAFYDNYFGLKVVRRDPRAHSGALVRQMTGVDGAELMSVFLSDGHFTLELIQFTKAQGPASRGPTSNNVGAPHIGFCVDDVRRVYREWSAEGIAFNGEPIMSSRGDSWSAMMLDPDGVCIELRETVAVPAEMMAAILA